MKREYAIFRYTIWDAPLTKREAKSLVKERRRKKPTAIFVVRKAPKNWMKVS